MKSVLHVRIDGPGYDSSEMEKAWKELGFEYFGFNWQSFRFNYGIDMLRQEVIRLAAYHKATIIFVHCQLPEVFDVDTFKQLQKFSNVVNYTFDTRDQERMQWMYDIAPSISLSVFASQDDVEVCKKTKCRRVMHSHSSCDMTRYNPFYNNHWQLDIPKVDIAFVGNNHIGSNLKFPLAQERYDMVKYLKDKYGEKFRCFGLGQEGGLIQPDVEATVYAHTKIAISQSNYEKECYTSDRLWRIMASGTFCLAKYFPGIEKLFEKEIHLDWWEDFGQLSDLIDYYLSAPEERKSIARAGMEVVRNQHSWTHRIAAIIKNLEI